MPSQTVAHLLTVKPKQQILDPMQRELPFAEVKNVHTTETKLKRQDTRIANFRSKKSISQMDFKQAKRDGICPFDNKSKALLTTKRDNKLCFMITDFDPRYASVRVFSIIMLNAWRNKRNENKQLLEEVQELRRGSIKAKNQLHVFNTLFRVEQKRNDDLNLQLKRSLEDVSQTKSSCETLTTSLISIRADKELLEQELSAKEQEIEDLNAILSQTKSDLFKAMTTQRELHTSLSMEQRKVQILENQKNDLINEIGVINKEGVQTEGKLRKQIEENTAELEDAKERLKNLDEILNILEEKKNRIEEHLKNEEMLRCEIELLKAEVSTLQNCLAATLGNRIKTCWNNSLSYQRTTCQVLHWLAFYMLPATPPPKIKTLPFPIRFPKIFSVIKS